MDIAVLGTGYVGLVTATVFAELGHRVIGVDIDAARVARLQRGETPIYEPGLDDLLDRNLASGRLTFTTDAAQAVGAAPIIFIAVGTPPAEDGSTDLSQVDEAARTIARHADGPRTVVNKSTVPVGTGARVLAVLQAENPRVAFTVLSNPEFLREGTAVQDALHPDRVVIGASTPEDAEPLMELYRPLDAPMVVTDIPSAEIIKYASNAFLATRLSFINAMADLCEAAGADVRMVSKGMGLDPRIGASFLNAGMGYGGSCLPKDVSSLINTCYQVGCHPALLDAVRMVNETRVPHLIGRMEDALGDLEGKTVAVLGLTFKPDTDDLRESRALELCRRLLERGATVRAHDPIAMPFAQRQLPEVEFCPTPLQAAAGADAVVLATEWHEYAALDLTAMRQTMHGDLLVDGRNLYTPARARTAGLRYISIGRAAEPARTQVRSEAL